MAEIGLRIAGMKRLPVDMDLSLVAIEAVWALACRERGHLVDILYVGPEDYVDLKRPITLDGVTQTMREWIGPIIQDVRIDLGLPVGTWGVGDANGIIAGSVGA